MPDKVALAKHFKVKPPSLYNHISNLDSLQRAMALRGTQELTVADQKAAMGRADFDALKAVAFIVILPSATPGFMHLHKYLMKTLTRNLNRQAEKL